MKRRERATMEKGPTSPVVWLVDADVAKWRGADGTG